MLQLVLAN